MRREMTQEMTREMSRVIGRVMPQAFLLCLTVWLTSLVFAQGPVNPRLLAARWPAQWIAAPTTPPFDYGVYHFRKTLELPAAPGRFLIHVSADNRYRLFVNGRFVAAGPPQSDLRNWRFNSIDLGPYLKAGRNVLAAVVWNGGEHRPMAQISHRTGFVLQGDSEREQAVNTGAGWKSSGAIGRDCPAQNIGGLGRGGGCGLAVNLPASQTRPTVPGGKDNDGARRVLCR